MTKSHGHQGLRNIGEGKDGEWKYQIRINLADEFATAARADLDDPKLAPLKAVLDRHGVTLKNQFDAFAGFCAEAEAAQQTDTPLYRWTKDLVDNPNKERQYASRFTVYEGENQIYSEELADAVMADLEPLKDSGMIKVISKIDSNPANNPQPPARFQR